MNAQARAAQTYLRGVQYSMQRVENTLERIRMLRCMAERITSNIDPNKVGGGASGNHSKVEDAVIEIADLERGMIGNVRDMRAKYEEARAIVEALPDEREKLILEMRYLSWEPEPWQKIMRRLCMERSQSFAIHHAALIHVYEKMNTK